MASIEQLENLLEKKQLEPYIRYIRFPFYKNLEDNLRIDFDFPITALVGQNGTNKSSVLRAIYGCPDTYNVGNFWFSTDLDPITEKSGNRPRFIYGYLNREYGKNVEVIKTRISKASNPDYWEPSRPILQDGMEKMPNEEGITGRSKTRWNAIKKSVTYIDFRSEISAFDKYFYHGDLKQTLRVNTKQDFLRNKSRKLNHIITSNIQTAKLYKNQDEHLFLNQDIPDEQVKEISRILGRKYKKIRLIKHKFFKNTGYTAILHSENLKYSEAFAGSGEFAVVQLVNKIMTAPKSSLIILDEPEVSLHPGAQERLVRFIFESIKNHKHQFVIGTHSPSIIKNLPARAVKVLFQELNSKKIAIAKCNSTDEAFFHLEHDTGKKHTVYVEDRLAREVVLRALSQIGQAAANLFDVKYYPGGAQSLVTRFLVQHALSSDENVYFFLDGDQCKDVDLTEKKLIALNLDELNELSKSYFGFDISVPCDGNRNGGNIAQQEDGFRKVLTFSSERVYFMPCKTPEMFIIQALGEAVFSKAELQENRPKVCFEMYARRLFNTPSFKEVDADDIFSAQKVALGKLSTEDLQPIKERLLMIMSN